MNIQSTRRIPKTIWGKNILRYLDDMEMSISDLGKCLGITQPAASNIVTGGGGLKAETLLIVCNIFDCTPNDIMLEGQPVAKKVNLPSKYKSAINTLRELLDE